MFTLPSSSKGFYSCWDAYPRVASPASSYNLSPPISPPSSPSRILTLLPKSRPASPLPSPLQTISEVFSQRASWPVFPLPLSERQNSDSDSRSSVISVSYAYSVRSVNSRKSRLTVRYPRPDRSHVHVESIIESAGASLESLSPFSSRPVSVTMSPQGNLVSIAESEHVADAMETLSMLFDSSPGDHFSVERRLSASWESLLKIRDYEEKHATPKLRATTIFAYTLLCVHNEIVMMRSVGVQELIRPCEALNEQGVRRRISSSL
ncbi:hypothetical protein BJV77DRAFT_760761 [Russula vinacea]|nr:hypothetical protein BJV77DRAFT_760761 [Russula vinacea]